MNLHSSNLIGLLFATISLHSVAETSDTQVSHSLPKEGRFFFNGGALSSFYEYENQDVKDALPSKITDRLEKYQVEGDESDIVNYNLAIGYYLYDDLALRFNYVADIEIDFLGDVFTDVCWLGCEPSQAKQRDYYTINMDIFEFDATYYPVHFTPKLSAYMLGGIAIHKIDATIYNRSTQSTPYTRVNVARSTELEAGAKLGVGIQYDFSDDWGLKAGYSHFSYMSIDKTYINFEYRL
ncbi:hypothetical protein PULV_a1821 [Pseudoalteromonas ulvae UL12]|uniref:Outer membrane protein beta-barrel domain-containing protein n=1 Tax=Pseudoalteromonas ulvae TaxID=107327 RepID=A0A244CP52_PSEDV|nr:hypothetical protein [Pseudoalteromonas ulvae]MBE0364226.1 hypothetical protein [Pseudoalteromonas ulvae UL12]OUL56989.1 hypothetical protein B1199_16630 [Pseudoalteromonas ulvae]